MKNKQAIHCVMLPAVFACILLAVLVAGCSGGQTPATDTAPFKKAIRLYLDERNMAMKVDEFKKLSVEGEEATAEVSLVHAEEIVAVQVQWSFRFRRKDGTWHVTGHEKH